MGNRFTPIIPLIADVDGILLNPAVCIAILSGVNIFILQLLPVFLNQFESHEDTTAFPASTEYARELSHRYLFLVPSRAFVIFFRLKPERHLEIFLGPIWTILRFIPFIMANITHPGSGRTG